MPFVPFVNTCRCELRFTQDGQEVANVFHVEGDAPLTVGDLGNIGATFVEWYEEFREVV